ncbi:MAG: YjbQ family protein [Actinobacteria bacterium]|nr:YjbQ family protein [Actinomycetota bacterium]
MKSQVESVDTSSSQFVDLTNAVRTFAGGGGDGLVNVFVPHATAGVALMETGSGSEEDLAGAIERVLPKAADYVHSHGSPGHGADHVLPAFVSPSVTLPVVDGEVSLGTWQSIVLVDTNRDNPRRKVRLSFIEG